MSTTTWHSRGREAKSPTEVPAKGWKDILMRVKDEVKRDRLTLISAAMAYYALFAFVPTISSIVLIYAWISDPSEIVGHINQVSQFMPEDMQKLLTSQLSTLASKTSSTLGLGAITSLVIALWSASKGSQAIIQGMNIIYDEEDKRSFIKSNLLAMGMTLLAAVLAIVAMGVVIVVPALTNLIPLAEEVAFLRTAVSWVILLGLFTFFLSFVYRYGPDRARAKWKWVSWGAVTAAVLWAIVSALFSWYAKEFGNFNKTYGSLGAIIVLMTWFYLSSFVILLGGEINAELEHQTKKDSTTGPEKPLGERGAEMADTVGKTTENIKASGGKTSVSPDRHQSPLH